MGQPGEGDVSELGEVGCPDGINFFVDSAIGLDDAVDCIELDEVGDWWQGPDRSKVVVNKEVVDAQCGGLSVLRCCEIELDGGHKGTASITGPMGDEVENEEQREGIYDVCRGSVIIGESCVCSEELFDGPRDRDQDAGRVAAGRMRKQVNYRYPIMTEDEGGYLYLCQMRRVGM